MAKIANYEVKFQTVKGQTSFSELDPEHRELVHEIASRYRLTFQELKRLCDAAQDVAMWGETSLLESWREKRPTLANRTSKERFLQTLESRMRSLRSGAKSYPSEGLDKPAPFALRPTVENSDKTVVGMCPVASEETVCCNLRTIDAVENCGFGCSYCSIQTFYGDEVAFDARLGAKLESVELDPSRFYHFGTGQSSDSLMWGNQNGVLDALCDFARKRPNVLLELKTKSKNVEYFLRHRTPPNVVLSWSLNTPTVINNEEHFTASLSERLGAARRVVDRGIKVAFHFHPLVYHENWRRDYTAVAKRLMEELSFEDVVFLSFGTVTFTKSVVKAIRKRGRSTKMLQMEMEPASKGKLSYPVRIKKEMFRAMYESLAPWHEDVFMYLCMEKRELWQATFGRAYDSNEAFEADFGRQVSRKLPPVSQTESQAEEAVATGSGK